MPQVPPRIASRTSRLPRYAWGVLAYNVGVILWGAYVRASGSGAGCGSHWPLCNGVIVQRAPSAATLVEYSHRVTSGIAFVSVVVLLVWTWRQRPSGDPSRTGAALSMLFMVTEAAVGAGLVLFSLVADNASMARALFDAVHLLNTFLLLACITLTAWWLSGGPPLDVRRRRGSLVAIVAGCAALLLASASGSVAALGDTLYPQGTLAAALRSDLSPTSHVLIRLRVFHPIIAATTAIALLFGASRLARGAGDGAETLGSVVAAVAGLQIAMGIINVLLLAPIAMQMLHLLVADALWIAFVLLSASVLAARAEMVGQP